MCLGSAFDVIESGRPPRATLLDYPLGHSAGKPFDPADQLSVIRAALQGLETMAQPGGKRILPNVWDASGEWRQDAARTKGRDTRQPRDETPQFQHAADREAAQASGALRG